MLEQFLYNQLRESVVLLAFGGQQALEPFGLTLDQYDALHLLGLAEGQRMGELSARLLSDNSKMTRTIDYLSEMGWVERRPDPSDRRAWCVYLTDAGVEQRQQATEAHQAYLKEQFGVLKSDEQERLCALFTALNQNLTP